MPRRRVNCAPFMQSQADSPWAPPPPGLAPHTPRTRPAAPKSYRQVPLSGRGTLNVFGRTGPVALLRDLEGSARNGCCSQVQPLAYTLTACPRCLASWSTVEIAHMRLCRDRRAESRDTGPWVSRWLSASSEFQRPQGAENVHTDSSKLFRTGEQLFLAGAAASVGPRGSPSPSRARTHIEGTRMRVGHAASA